MGTIAKLTMRNNVYRKVVHISKHSCGESVVKIHGDKHCRESRGLTRGHLSSRANVHATSHTVCLV